MQVGSWNKHGLITDMNGSDKTEKMNSNNNDYYPAA